MVIPFQHFGVFVPLSILVFIIKGVILIIFIRNILLELVAVLHILGLMARAYCGRTPRGVGHLVLSVSRGALSNYSPHAPLFFLHLLVWIQR